MNASRDENIKTRSEVVVLQKLTTGVKFVRRNSSESTTNTYPFGRGEVAYVLG
jgi:hypothetical protein